MRETSTDRVTARVFTSTLDKMQADGLITSPAKGRIRALRRHGDEYASDVLQKAALDALEKREGVISDNRARSAQRSRTNDSRQYHKLHASADQNFSGSDRSSTKEVDISAPLPSLMHEAHPDEVLKEAPAEVQHSSRSFDDSGSDRTEQTPPTSDETASHDPRVSLPGVDTSQLCADTQKLVDKLEVAETRWLTIEESKKDLSKERKISATARQKGIVKKFYENEHTQSALPKAMIEIKDQIESNRIMRGADRLPDQNTPYPNTLIEGPHPKLLVQIDSTYSKQERDFETRDRGFNAFQNWKRRKEKFNQAFLANCRKQVPDSFEKFMRPIRTTSSCVVEEYKKRNIPAGYAPFNAHQICGNGLTAGTNWLFEYALRDDHMPTKAQQAGAAEMEALTAEEELAWNKTQPAWRRAHGVELRETLQ